MRSLVPGGLRNDHRSFFISGRSRQERPQKNIIDMHIPASEFPLVWIQVQRACTLRVCRHSREAANNEWYRLTDKIIRL
jgi:hypothetical protein